MQITVAVLLADGFEEIETRVFIDVVRHSEMKVDILACKLLTYYEPLITTD